MSKTTKDFAQHMVDALESWHQENPKDYINPHYLTEVVGAIDNGYYVEDFPYHLSKWSSDMWGY